MLEHMIFVGRQREQDLLSREFLKTLSGQTRVGLVWGEPGIGKTRLLTQFAKGAEKDGALILHGFASKTEGMPPYLPFLEALGSYIRAAPLDLLREQAGAHAPALAPLFPEITQRLGNPATAYALPTEQARFRLYKAIALFFSNLCERQPVLLLLDDLQWADSASLDLLMYVVRHQPRLRLFVLGGMRGGEETRVDLAHLLAELERLRSLIIVELLPLTANEVAQSAAHLLGAPLESEASQVLFARSEGNPFFAEELLRNWQEMGRLRRLSLTWKLDLPAEDEFPPSILRAIEQRLIRLPTQTIELLRGAAILGRHFEVGLLAETLGQEAEAVEALLLPVTQTGLLRQDKRGFAFGHDLIREALYRQVPATRRQRLHGFIGHTLESRASIRDPQHLAELAFHFARSGDRARGIHYTRLAAEEALRAYAAKEAVRLYQAGLGLLESMERDGVATSLQQRGELLLGLGEAALQSGMEPDAIRAFESALTCFKRSGDPLSAARAAHGLGRARWQVEEIPAAQAAFTLALELAGNESSPLAAQIHVDLANLLVLSRHQYTEGMSHAQRALDIAGHLEDNHLMAAAWRVIGNLHVRANRPSEGIAALDNALALAVASDDLPEAAETCTGLLIALAWNCRTERIGEISDKLIDFAQRCQTRYYLRHVHSHLFFLHMLQGNLEAAGEALAQAEAMVEHLAGPEPLALLKISHAFGAYVTGSTAEFETLATEAIAIFRSFGPEALVWYLGLQALAKLENGRHEEARACRDELEALLRAMPEEAFPTAEAFAHLALFALALGEYDRLPDLHSRLLPFRGQFHDALIDRLLGAIEIVQKDWESAQASLDAAETIARREGFRWELAHTLASHADLELARGGPGSAKRARQRLAEALDIFKAYGNKTQEKRIRERLRALLRQPGEKPAQPLPAGLSPRELDVLRLIGQGKSNREIAEALALSEKTVANHVTAIFNKLGVDNRVAAAASAVRQGLV